MKNNRIDVMGASVTVLNVDTSDFISITDIARFKDLERTEYIIQNWLRNRNTIEFYGFRKRAQLNSNYIGIQQMKILISDAGIKHLEMKSDE